MLLFNKLEVGKFYRDGRGIVHRIDKLNDNELGVSRGYLFIASGRGYQGNGVYDHLNPESREDLVEEVNQYDFIEDPAEAWYRARGIFKLRNTSGDTFEAECEKMRNDPDVAQAYEHALGTIVTLMKTKPDQ